MYIDVNIVRQWESTYFTEQNKLKLETQMDTDGSHSFTFSILNPMSISTCDVFFVTLEYIAEGTCNKLQILVLWGLSYDPGSSNWNPLFLTDKSSARNDVGAEDV